MTSRLPSWARGLASYEAQGNEDMANLRGSAGTITPEEAYGFESTGGGHPGRIKGTTRQNDLASLRAFRGRTSLGSSPMLSSAGIDSRIRGRADAAQADRYKFWDSVMRQQRGLPAPGAAPAPARIGPKPMVSVGGGGQSPPGLVMGIPGAASHVPQMSAPAPAAGGGLGPKFEGHISPESWKTPAVPSFVDPQRTAEAMTRGGNAQYAGGGVASSSKPEQSGADRLRAAMNIGSNARYK